MIQELGDREEEDLIMMLKSMRQKIKDKRGRERERVSEGDISAA
jgi:hypothetical protein